MASDAELEVVASLVADPDDFVTAFTVTAPEAVRSGMAKVQEAVESGAKKVTEGLNAAAEGAREAGEETGKSFGEGMTLVLAAIATAFLDKLHETFSEATEMAEELKNAVAQTGDSVAGVQRLEYAFATFGVGAQEAANSIVLFNRKLEEAAQRGKGNDLFSRNGLDPKKMVDQSASTNIEQVSNAMRGLSTSAERDDLAMYAFGRAGRQLIPILVEGGDALTALEESADKAGGVLGGGAVTALDNLQMKMNQLAFTSKVFYASFIAPFAGAFKAIAQAVQDTYAAFERLSDDTKLAVIFTAIGGAALLAEDGLMAFRPILGSLINKEALDSLLEMSSIITGLVPVVGALAVAWATNFGGMKTIVFELGEIIKQFWTRIVDAFQAIAYYAKSVLGSAFDDMQTQLGLLWQAWVDLAKAVLDNPDAFSAFKDAADDVIDALKALLDLNNRIIPVITDMVTGIKDHLAPALTALGIVILGVNAKMLFTGAVAAIGQVTKAITILRDAYTVLILLTEGENILLLANPWGLVVAGAVALAAAVYALWTNWNGCRDAIMGVLGPLAQFVAFWSGFDLYVAGVEKLAQGFEWVGRAIENATDKWNKYNTAQDQANDAKRTAEALAKAQGSLAANVGTAPGDQSPSSTPDADLHAVELAEGERRKRAADNEAAYLANRKKEAEERERKGGHHTTPPAVKSTANSDALDALKESLYPYQEAIRKTEMQLSQLALAQAMLGKIDTYDKMQRAVGLYGQQIAATMKLQQQERNEAAQDLRNKQAVNALEAKAKDPKEKKRDREAANSYGKDYDNETLKAQQEALKIQKFREERQAAPGTFDKSQAEDSALPTAVRLKAVDDAILDTTREIVASGQQQIVHNEKLAKLEQTKLDILSQAAKLQNDLTNSQDATVKARVNAQKSVADAETLGPDPTGAKAQARAIADATADHTNAQIDADAATKAATMAQEQLKEATDSLHASDTMLLKLQTDVNNATAAQTTAQAALAVSTIKLEEAQKTTDITSKTLNDGLMKMAQQVAGPIMDAINLIQEGVNPLVAIFVSLFEKSKSFNDILVILGKVIDTVAQIFDAMRPVIDLLLGVLVGVVNVFITLYNIVVSLLDVFGLGIAKIKLVTDSLQPLQGAVPLLQVTHDLPTMNEINSGKSADLVAKANDLNNNMNAGFNAGLSKIGEIAGTLIGIYATTKIIAAIAGGQGAGAGVSGLVNQVLGLFGKGTSSGTGGATDANFGTGGNTPGSLPGGFLGNDTSGGGDPGDVSLPSSVARSGRQTLSKADTASAVQTGVQNVIPSSSALVQTAGTLSSAMVQAGVDASTFIADIDAQLKLLVQSMKQSANSASDNPLASLLGGSGGSDGGGSVIGANTYGTAQDSAGANNYGFGTGNYGPSDPGDVMPSSTQRQAVPSDSIINQNASAHSKAVAKGLDSSQAGTAIIAIVGALTSKSDTGPGAGSSGEMFYNIGHSLASNLEKVASGQESLTAALGSLEQTVSVDIANKIGGGRSDSNQFASIGGQLGQTFGGLPGQAIGTFIGSIIGSFIGPKKPSDNTTPDQTNATINGEAYGQAIANLQGGSGDLANGTQYTPAAGDSTGILQQISSYIASGGKGLSANLLKEFTGATSIVNGKNGILDLANGVDLQWQQLVNDANTAMAAITGAGGNMANQMQQLLGGATNVNLAQLFGNGTSVTPAGGYNVTGGGNSTLGNTPTTNPDRHASSFTVNIAAVHGTVDQTALRNAFKPIFDEYGRQQQIVARTQSSMVGRGNF